jgi:hypothetical protein
MDEKFTSYMYGKGGRRKMMVEIVNLLQYSC